MKKFSLIAMILSLMLLSAAGAMAGTVVINDTPGIGLPYTQLHQWTSVVDPTQPYLGNPVWTDAEGNEFATQRVTVTTSPSSLIIQILTNNQPGGWVVAGVNWGVADIALNVSPDTTSYDAYTKNHFAASGVPNITSPYELGIIMQGYTIGNPTDPGSAGATLVKVNEWTTSFNNVNTSGVGGNYGGGYKQDTAPESATRQPVEDRITSQGDVLATGTLTWAPNGTTYLTYEEYLLTVTFQNITGLDEPFDFLWATSRCANDVVNSPVPLPSTLLLLCTGILGLVGLGWKRTQMAPAAV